MLKRSWMWGVLFLGLVAQEGWADIFYFYFPYPNKSLREVNLIQEQWKKEILETDVIEEINDEIDEAFPETQVPVIVGVYYYNRFGVSIQVQTPSQKMSKNTESFYFDKIKKAFKKKALFSNQEFQVLSEISFKNEARQLYPKGQALTRRSSSLSQERTETCKVAPPCVLF